jgi:hypothetical protein
MLRLWELLAVAQIIGITYYHCELFTANKKISPLFHAEWALAYFLPGLLVAFLFHSWRLLEAWAVIRLVAYNPILNRWRHLGIFYLSSGKNGSLFDKIEMKWIKFFPYFWLASLVLLIALQFLHWQ